MKKTYVNFSSIKEDEELGIMVGCCCGDNNQMVDALCSLLDVSIQGQRIVTIDKDLDIVWIGLGEDGDLLKFFFYNKNFIVYHDGRKFIRMEEVEE